MKKTAYLFPGQGAQAVGMAKEFYEEFPVSRDIFQLASASTGLNVAELCFSENDRLNQTEYTQIALLTAELAIFEAVKESGGECAVTAGQSLGEYAALVAAGYFRPADAMRLVRTRGILMQNAVPIGQGAMVAVIGLTAEKVEALCREGGGEVQVSNYNTPRQTVISGARDAVMRVKRLAEESGARMAVELSISVPSHSALMKPAAEQLERVLEAVEVKRGTIPYVSNVNASFVSDSTQIKPLLVRQMYSAVKWEQSIRAMQAEGIEVFAEIGPGDALANMNRKIDRRLCSINISKLTDLDKLRQ